MFDMYGISTSSHVVPNDIEEFRVGFSHNTGNLIFHYAYELLVDGSGRKFPWRTGSEIINNESKGMIAPMANHLGGHVDLGVSGPRIKGVRVPVVAMGLGAQFGINKLDVNKIPEGTKEWLKVLASTTDKVNISVRGDDTYKLMCELGFEKSTVALGCPSLFINKNRSLGADIRRRLKSLSSSNVRSEAVVVAGNPFRKEFNKVERMLINWVENYGAEYIVQNPKPLIELSCGWSVDDLNCDIVRTSWFPGLSNMDVKKWFKEKSKTYISVPQWIFDLSGKEVCIGTRIHGVQAAIQAGTPALCLCVDSRTKELCEFMKIPHLIASDLKESFTIDEGISFLRDWDWGLFDENRVELAKKTRDFLVGNGVSLRKHLSSLC